MGGGTAGWWGGGKYVIWKMWLRRVASGAIICVGVGRTVCECKPSKLTARLNCNQGYRLGFCSGAQGGGVKTLEMGFTTYFVASKNSAVLTFG